MDHVVPVQGRRYTVRYSSSVLDRKRRYAALCGTGYGAAALAVRGWNRNTPEELFREAIRKLPRRWQPYITWERNMFR